MQFHISYFTGEIPSHFDPDTCKKELSTFYLNQMGIIPLLPGRHETKEIDKIFTLPEMHYNESILPQVHNLATLTTEDGKCVKRILVTSQVKGGRSTILTKLAHEWAKQDPRSPLSKYDLLFMFDISELHSSKSLVDVIFETILSVDTKVSKEGLESYLQLHSDKILILVDNFVSETLSSNSIGEFEQIVMNRKLRECCLITTTCQEDIEKLGKYNMLFTHMKLGGFSSTNVSNYIHRFFGRNKTSAANLIEHMNSSPTLTSVIRTPGFLAYFCLLWKEQIAFPQTSAQVCKLVVNFLWKCHVTKKNLFEDPTENKQQLDQFLTSIGKAVCDHLSMDKHDLMSFTEKDFSSSELLEQGISLGLLTKQNLVSLEESSLVQFHKRLLQEYCATCYLVHLVTTDVMAFQQWLNLKIRDTNMVQMSMNILCFCGSLNSDAAKLILQHVTSLLSRSNNIDRWLLLELFMESSLQYHDVHSLFTTLFSTRTLAIPTLCTSTKEALQKFVKTVLADHDSCFMANKQGLEFHDFLAEGDALIQLLPKMQSLTSLKLIQTNSTVLQGHRYQSTLNKVAEQIASLSDLSHLSIYTSSRLNINASVLLEKLQRIDISQLCLTNVSCQVHHLVSFLSGHPLALLELDNVSIGIISACELYHVLRAIPKQLQHLILRNMSWISESIPEIYHLIPELEHLDLSRVNLEERHMLHLAENLHQAKKLQVLDLSFNNIGKAIETEKVSKKLAYCCKSLRHLYLNDCDIRDLKYIAKMLRELKNLETLRISYNAFGVRGLKHLFANIHFLPLLHQVVANDIVVIDGKEYRSKTVEKCLKVLDMDMKKVLVKETLDLRIKSREEVVAICSIAHHYLTPSPPRYYAKKRKLWVEWERSYHTLDSTLLHKKHTPIICTLYE